MNTRITQSLFDAIKKEISDSGKSQDEKQDAIIELLDANPNVFKMNDKYYFCGNERNGFAGLSLASYRLRGNNVFNVANSDGMTLMSYCAMINNTDMAKWLKEQGASIEIPDNVGCYPIHYAALYNSKPFLEFLFIHGVHYGVKTNQLFSILTANGDKAIPIGSTALHIAARLNNAFAIQSILANGEGAENVVDQNRATPKDVAGNKNLFVSDRNTVIGVVAHNFLIPRKDIKVSSPLVDSDPATCVGADDDDVSQVLTELCSFINARISELEKTNFFKSKGVKDKVELYRDLLTRLEIVNQDPALDKLSVIIPIIKECAIISHHKRHSKFNAIVSFFPGVTEIEAKSWTAWKALCANMIPEAGNGSAANYCKFIFQQTLRGKEARRFDHDNDANNAIDNSYNNYRSAYKRVKNG